jgi:hypothetical protein
MHKAGMIDFSWVVHFEEAEVMGEREREEKKVRKGK